MGVALGSLVAVGAVVAVGSAVAVAEGSGVGVYVGSGVGGSNTTITVAVRLPSENCRARAWACRPTAGVPTIWVAGVIDNRTPSIVIDDPAE